MAVNVTEDVKRFTDEQDESGRKGVRYFNVVASSSNQARQSLWVEKQVRYGEKFKDPFNNLISSASRCRSLQVSVKSPPPFNGTGLYSIVARYQVDQGNRSRPNPTPGEGAVYHWYRIEESETPELDLAGVPIANVPFGEPLNDAPPIARTRRGLNVRWYVDEEPNLQQLFTYDDTYNNFVWLIDGQWRVEIGQAKCRGVNIESREDADLHLMNADFEFRFQGRLWHPYQVFNNRLLDNGNRVLLNAAGEVVTAPADAHVLEFTLLNGADWSSLEI